MPAVSSVQVNRSATSSFGFERRGVQEAHVQRTSRYAAGFFKVLSFSLLVSNAEARVKLQHLRQPPPNYNGGEGDDTLTLIFVTFQLVVFAGFFFFRLRGR
jgi:hypothetical protein